jgi:hypothetical protein
LFRKDDHVVNVRIRTGILARPFAAAERGQKVVTRAARAAVVWELALSFGNILKTRNPKASTISKLR